MIYIVYIYIYVHVFLHVQNGEAWFSRGYPRVRRDPKGGFVLDIAGGTPPIPVDLSLAIIAYPAVLSYRGT